MSNFLSEYIASPTHKWWVEKVWRPSWTRFLTFIYGIPALILSGFEVLATWGNDSTIAGYLDKLHMPNWVPMAFAGIALTHYIAHGRKAGEA